MASSTASAQAAPFCSIEARIGTDLKDVKEAQMKLRDDVARTDKALMELLGNEEFAKKLAVDVSQIPIDEEAIRDLESREQQERAKKKKFTSPYASSTTSLNSSNVEDMSAKAIKKSGMLSNFLSIIGKEVKVSKKDLKKWEELMSSAANERKTRDGCLELLNVHRETPEKGSPEAVRELEYQISEQERKIHLLAVGCDQTVPLHLMTAEHKAKYNQTFY